MDDKTWQQVNLCSSTVTVRGNQALRAQNVPSATGSVYSGAPSNHWQRMTCCSRFNGVTNSQSIPSQQQFNQIQQQVPLRYFQIQKPATSLQYGNRISSASLGPHHLGNHPNHQQHFTHLCTVLRTSSNDSSILEKTTRYGRENATVKQSLSLKSLEDIQILNNHNNRTDELINHTKNESNLISTLDKSPKYQILTNGHSVVPETSQTSSFSIPIDHVIPQAFIALDNREHHPSRFVNAIEAVPDMLREVRPGSTSFFPENSSKFSFLIDQDEFSYHASNKPELRNETTVASMEIQSDRNWPELSLRNHRSYASIIDPKMVNLRIEEKTYCEAESTISKEMFIKEADNDGKSCNDSTYTEKTINTSPVQKTYADAVQLMTGRHEISSPRHVRIDGVRTNIQRLKLPEESTKLANVSQTPFREEMSNKMTARCTRKKREYESCDEDNDDTTLFISNELGKMKNHDVCSWRQVGILENDKAASSLRAGQHQGRSPSRKRMCKMAEIFCLEQLENPTFFRAFDDYNRRRRRMSYTRKFEAKPEDTWSQQNEASNCKIRGGVTVITGLALERQDAFFCNDFSTKLRRNVFCSNSPLCEEMLIKDSGTISQLRFNGMMDKGVFKVLQKLKECADGTGALYTNSWRPEEIHFLRRCHRDKMAV